MTWLSICMSIIMICGVFNILLIVGTALTSGLETKESIPDVIDQIVIVSLAFLLYVADGDLTNTWGKDGVGDGLETNATITIRDTTTAARKINHSGEVFYILPETAVQAVQEVSIRK